MKLKVLLRLEEDLKSKLKEISQIEKRSLSSLIVKILSDYSSSYQKKGEQNEN